MFYVKNISGTNLLLRDFKEAIDISLAPDECVDLVQFAPSFVLNKSIIIQTAFDQDKILRLTKGDFQSATEKGGENEKEERPISELKCKKEKRRNE